MAENMPRTTPEFVSWSRAHAEQWAQDPPAIGLSDLLAAQFAASSAELAAAEQAAVEARQASIDATLRLANALAATRAIAGVCVATIKLHARSTDDPDVYGRSGVSPVARQSVLPAPRPPTSIFSSINPDGSLLLTWKARQPAGVTDVAYTIHRRLEGEPAFTLVGVEGKNKSFVDGSLPRGIGRVEYLIQPKRGEEWGEQSAMHTVQIGTLAERERAGMRRAA